MKTFKEFYIDAYSQLDEGNFLDTAKQFVSKQISNVKADPVGTAKRAIIKPFVKSVVLDATGIPDKLKRAGGNNPVVNTAVDYGTGAISLAPWRQALKPKNLKTAANIATKVVQNVPRVVQGAAAVGSTLMGLDRVGGMP